MIGKGFCAENWVEFIIGFGCCCCCCCCGPFGAIADGLVVDLTFVLSFDSVADSANREKSNFEDFFLLWICGEIEEEEVDDCGDLAELLAAMQAFWNVWCAAAANRNEGNEWLIFWWNGKSGENAFKGGIAKRWEWLVFCRECDWNEGIVECIAEGINWWGIELWINDLLFDENRCSFVESVLKN